MRLCARGAVTTRSVAYGGQPHFYRTREPQPPRELTVRKFTPILLSYDSPDNAGYS